MTLARAVAFLFAALVVQLGVQTPAQAQDAQPAPEAAPAAPAAGPAAPPAAAPAAAAPAPAAAAGRQEQTEEITVTGSRLRRKDLNTPAPVTVITRAEIISSGKLTVAEYLQSLPEQGNSLNMNANNGGTGQTTVNLRALDTAFAARTLVLLNGRRMVNSGRGATGFVDLNTIPSSAVERIEVLKDGASAVYGADAIAGVVNIITRKNFNTTEAIFNTGISSRNDATTADLALSTGSVGEKTSTFFSANYYRQDVVTSYRRPWSEFALSYDYFTGERSKGGSGSTPAPKMIFDSAQVSTTAGLDPNSLQYKLITACPTFTTDPSKCPKNFILDPGASGVYAGLGWRPSAGDSYNFAAQNYMVTPQKRVGIFAAADTKIGDHARFYMEGSYANKRQQAALAEEPMWGTLYYGFKMSAGSEYNPSWQAPGGSTTSTFSGVDVDFRRRLVEAGRRQEVNEDDVFRGLAGIDGTLADWAGPLRGWTWDVSFNYGRDVGSHTYNGNLNVLQIRSAVGPSFGGKCYSTWDSTQGHVQAAYSGEIAGCVPLNILGAPGSITSDQINALTFTGPSKGYNQQQVTQATLSGELFTLAADRPAGLALGVEYRKNEGQDVPDPFTVFGYTSGSTGSIVGGTIDVFDGFGEIAIPIVSGMPFADDLEVSIAGRVFKYNLYDADSTYKFGAKWRPIRDVTLRGTYGTAYRAPTVGELYSGTALSADPANDPCDDFTRIDANPTLSAQQKTDYKARCTLLAGAANANPQNGPITQIYATTSGNPNLKPEKADTLTAGIVYQPRQVKNLSLTVDFYDINITNPIQRDGAQFVVNSCVIGGVQSACDRITWTGGDVSNVNDPLANQGREQRQGVDMGFRWMIPTAVGRFGLAFDGSYLIKHDITKSASTGGGILHAKGTYDLVNSNITGGVNPSFKANAGVQYFLGQFVGGLTARYIGSFKECSGSLDGNSGGTDCTYAGDISHTVPSVTTYNANAGYSFGSTYGKTTLAAGIENLFDQAPPVIYSNITQWSDWNYDFLGRRYYFRVAQTF